MSRVLSLLASSAATGTVTTSPDGSEVIVLHPQQFTAFGVGLVRVVFLLAALLAAQLRRPNA